MKSIPLSRGLETIVDDEDYDFLTRWKWHATDDGYVRRTARIERIPYTKSTTVPIPMANMIMQPKIGEILDHINGDPLDNRRLNLRICNQADNKKNRWKPNIKTTSSYKGVYRDSHKWKAQICINRKVLNLGRFKTEYEAALAYDKAALK